MQQYNANVFGHFLTLCGIQQSLNLVSFICCDIFILYRPNILIFMVIFIMFFDDGDDDDDDDCSCLKNVLLTFLLI